MLKAIHAQERSPDGRGEGGKCDRRPGGSTPAKGRQDPLRGSRRDAHLLRFPRTPLAAPARQQSARTDPARDRPTAPRGRRLTRRRSGTQPGGRAASPHRRQPVVDQALPRHGAAGRPEARPGERRVRTQRRPLLAIARRDPSGPPSPARQAQDVARLPSRGKPPRRVAPLRAAIDRAGRTTKHQPKVRKGATTRERPETGTGPSPRTNLRKTMDTTEPVVSPQPPANGPPTTTQFEPPARTCAGHSSHRHLRPRAPDLRHHQSNSCSGPST